MKALVFALLVLGASVGFAGVPYPGNDSDHGVTRPHGQLDPYTGNAGFAVRDLVVAGAVGRYRLTWARHANSRTSQSEAWFGLAHNWTHSWQWEMVDEGRDSQGRAVLSVREPEGWVHRFTETSPGAWWSAPSVRDHVISDGNQFRLLRFDASEVQFTRQRSGAGATFAAHAVIDPEGNRWKLTYDAGRLAQVTEPAGRWLKISYSELSAPLAAKGVKPFTVITQVAASDGQVVTYAYAFSAGTDYPVLTEASYPDGTKATYVYTAPRQGTRLLLKQAIDPRANRYVRGRIFSYCAEADAAIGQLSEIRTADKGAILQTLGVDGTRLRSYAVRQDNGATVYRVFNPGGNTAEEIDALGYVKKFDYDADGRGYLIATTDELGHVTRRENDPHGMAVKQIWPDGAVSTWAHDDRGRLLAGTDELGNTRSYVRDAKGRTVKVQNPDGTSEETTYNDFGQVITRKGRSGAVTAMTYDGRGLLQKTTDALGYSRAFNYDSRDRLAAVTDPRGNTTRYEHDTAGRVIKTTYADGAHTARDYDEFGHVTRTTDAAGAVRTMTYDQFGRLIATFDPLGHETRTVYSDSGAGAAFNRPIAIVSPTGRTTATAYDENGRLVARTIAADTRQAATTRYAYDPAGRRSSVTNPRGKTVQYFYDERGRRVKTMNALNYATSFTYDTAGHRLSQTDAKGNTTIWTYDAMGRVLTKTDALGHVTARSYNAAGRLATLTDPKGRTYRFEYNALSRPTALVYPDGSREATTYDEAENKRTFTNRAGVTQTFAYDIRNREVHSEWSDGSQTIAKAYDVAGRMSLEDNGVSKLIFAYDKTGRLASETQDLSPTVTDGAVDPAPRTVDYTYDADGQRETLGYPDGSFVKFTYNARGRLAEILGDGVPPPIGSYDYDAAGNATLMPRENLTETIREYDAENKMTGITERGPDRSPLGAVDYTYDEVGNRTATFATQDLDGGAVAESRLDAYHYDATYQVTGADYGAKVGPGSSRISAPAKSVRFTYDAVGNRLQVDENGTVTRYTVNNLNQYTQVGAFAPTHDRNGNLSGMGQWLYRYDALNRLIFASNGTMTAKFFYDATNRCVARVFNGATTLNTYDNWNLIEERDGSGAQQARYVQGRKIDEIVVMVNRHGTFYPHYDALGNVTMLTGKDGHLVERYGYSVTGQVTISNAEGEILPESAVDNRWMFTGREWIQKVGLYDYRNRVYSAELGRFLQTDPIGFSAGDLDIYRYVGHRYLNERDPMGLSPESVFTNTFVGMSPGELGTTVNMGYGYYQATGQSLNLNSAADAYFDHQTEQIAEAYTIITGGAGIVLAAPEIAVSAASAWEAAVFFAYTNPEVVITTADIISQMAPDTPPSLPETTLGGIAYVASKISDTVGEWWDDLWE